LPETLFTIIRPRGPLGPLQRFRLRHQRKFKRRLNEPAARRLHPPLHMFVVSLRCNHTCKYCQVSRQSEDRAAFDMTEEIADRAIDFTFRSPSRSIKIEFQGGEPLLNFPLIKYIVVKAKERNLVERRNLAFVVTTNLSPITDEILAFCQEHDIYISCSLDGPEDLHNANRPKEGNNSYRLTLEGIRHGSAKAWG
jgi:uncharacterized protein